MAARAAVWCLAALAGCGPGELTARAARRVVLDRHGSRLLMQTFELGAVTTCGGCAEFETRCPNYVALRAAGIVRHGCEAGAPRVELVEGARALLTGTCTTGAQVFCSVALARFRLDEVAVTPRDEEHGAARYRWRWEPLPLGVELTRLGLRPTSLFGGGASNPQLPDTVLAIDAPQEATIELDRTKYGWFAVSGAPSGSFIR